MIKLFKNLEKKDIIMIIFVFALIVFQVWLDLKLPDYMSQITTLIQKDGSTMQDILTQGMYMIFCSLGSLISAVIVGYLTATISSNFSMNLRKKIFNKVMLFSTAEIKKFQTSSLITRTTNDVTQMEMLIAFGMQMLIKAPIMAIWAITKILNKSLELSILTGICVIVLLITIFIIMFNVLPRFKIIQKLVDKINGLTRENLTGVRVIRAFNAEEYQKDKFKETNANLTNNQLFTQKAFSFMNPMMNLVMHSLSLGIYFIGAILIENAGMYDKIQTFSNIVVFTSYGMQVIMSFLMLAMIFMIIPRAQISANRINEILDEKLSIIEGNYNEKAKIDGEVEFKDVSFKYPDADEYLIKNISFKVKKGETIAFIGSTGSGKSTLINLVPRFYDATDGKVLVDGVDVRDYKLSDLHDKIGYISQKPFMFDASIKDNIKYGKSSKKITDKKVKEAIKIAQAEEFVSRLEDGIDSHIARGGTNISGGQKQRLSIARAIAKDPEIYIFDDSFSALDFKTDLKLRQELKKYTKDAIVMIVAQRIGTIMNSDKIVVLEDGNCVGIGTHKQLLENCDVYKEIALSQLSKEELENA